MVLDREDGAAAVLDPFHRAVVEVQVGDAQVGRTLDPFRVTLHGKPVILRGDLDGAVGEAPSAAVAESLNAAAKSAGFTPKVPVLEISGVCAHCRAA